MLHLRYWLLFLVFVRISSEVQAPRIPDGYKLCPIPTQYTFAGWSINTELCPQKNHSCMAIFLRGGEFKAGGCVLNKDNSFYNPNKTSDYNNWNENPCDKLTGKHTISRDVDGSFKVKVCCDDPCPQDPTEWKDVFDNQWLPCVVGTIGGLTSFGYTLSFTHTCYVKCRAKKVVLKAKKRRSKKSKKKPERSQSPPR